MSSSLLEQIRSNHEHLELYEQAVIAELSIKPSGQKAKTWQQHQISTLLERSVATSKNLEKLYNDTDGILKDELQAMRGSNIFGSFYETLKSTREYHQRFPNLSVEHGPNLSDIDINVPFSGEELFGKYLDLHSFYLRFCNLPKIGSGDIDYLHYLDKFNSFFHIAESNKDSKAYVEYVRDLWDYLISFFGRVQPLVDLDEPMRDWESTFERQWSKDEVLGWKGTSAGPSQSSGPQPLRLGMFNAPSELEALGMDRLKEALMALGLKCGGTLQDRANRLWSVRGKKSEDIPAKLKAPKAAGEAAQNNRSDSRKNIAWTEFRIQALSEVMSDIITSTRRHAEKQQTRSVEEKEAEREEEEFGLLPDLGADDYEEGGRGPGEDDDAPLYNPLNLPLGWDGKPIPFWLYKLHGLGVEYKCEICGNQSYWGRRAFDKHFQEWRHAHGMRCLGVPNTKHFHDITLIEDALALYAKIKGSLKTEVFTGEVDEEFEDSEGNVLNRRTYEDLARQGLL